MKLTIRNIKSTGFINLYKKLLSNSILNKSEYLTLLSVAVIMLNSDDSNVKKWGYRTIVIYCNQTKDYAPLYEIAINQGLYPIVKYIDNKVLGESHNVFTELNSAYLEIFKSGNVYFSEQQYRLNSFYSKNKDNSISVVAPTSYGKTELIIKTIQECKNKNICIITPTKALLSQTRNRILKAKIEWIHKVVVHPDMYNNNDENCVAVLTQERLLRLLKNNPSLSFNYVIVDEAHNILNSTNREEMLASTIIVLNKRNPQTAFKFLTPFINNSDNLNIKYTSYDLSDFIIKEYIKTEKIYLYDIRSNTGLSLYDQFINDWIHIDNEPTNQTSIQFIVNHCSDKNIIYFNKPSDIEEYAREMIANLPDLELNDDLNKAIEHISQYIDPEYTLVKCLRKGIIYHHGSVPDSIRGYIEFLFAKMPEIRYVITSSTLLEGVNIPASRLFIMNNKKGRSSLNGSAFKNLIGRICRFSEVFDNEDGSLKKLEPEIYLVFDKYYDKRTNIKTFISKVMKIDKTENDIVDNVLLENTIIDTDSKIIELNKANEFLENYEEGVIDNYSKRLTKTPVGKSCVLNNVNEFDIFEREEDLQREIERYKEYCSKINDSNILIEQIYKLFISNISNDSDNNSILRFTHEPTRNYYKMFLSWKLESLPYSEMIHRIVNYWRHLISKHDNTIVYVGKWGDTQLFEKGRSIYTDVRTKDQTQLVNLAIVRIKEEQDYLDNTIMKYVEVLNDVELIEPELYSRIKYGTNNKIEMVMIKNGISLSLTKLLIEKYKDYFMCNLNNDTIELKPSLIKHMKNNNENSILIFEAENNVF